MSGKVFKKSDVWSHFAGGIFRLGYSWRPAPHLSPRETRPVVRRNLLRPASGSALRARRKANTTIGGHPADQPEAPVKLHRRHLALTMSSFALVHILTRDARPFQLPKSGQSRPEQAVCRLAVLVIVRGLG
jgi:hypothetical protein